MNEYDMRAAAQDAYNRQTVALLKSAARSLDDPSFVADATASVGADLRNTVADKMSDRGSASYVASAIPYAASRLRSRGAAASAGNNGQYVSRLIELLRSPVSAPLDSLVGAPVMSPAAMAGSALTATGVIDRGGPEDRQKLKRKLELAKLLGEDDAEEPKINRLTTLQALSAARMREADHTIAGHSKIRRDNTAEYYLDPTIATGPIHEISDRIARRVAAVGADPEQYLPVRALSHVPLLGSLTAIGGGEETRKRVRGLLNKELE